MVKYTKITICKKLALIVLIFLLVPIYNSHSINVYPYWGYTTDYEDEDETPEPSSQSSPESSLQPPLENTSPVTIIDEIEAYTAELRILTSEEISEIRRKAVDQLGIFLESIYPSLTSNTRRYFSERFLTPLVQRLDMLVNDLNLDLDKRKEIDIYRKELLNILQGLDGDFSPDEESPFQRYLTGNLNSLIEGINQELEQEIKPLIQRWAEDPDALSDNQKREVVNRLMELKKKIGFLNSNFSLSTLENAVNTLQSLSDENSGMSAENVLPTELMGAISGDLNSLLSSVSSKREDVTETKERLSDLEREVASLSSEIASIEGEQNNIISTQSAPESPGQQPQGEEVPKNPEESETASSLTAPLSTSNTEFQNSTPQTGEPESESTISTPEIGANSENNEGGFSISIQLGGENGASIESEEMPASDSFTGSSSQVTTSFTNDGETSFPGGSSIIEPFAQNGVNSSGIEEGKIDIGTQSITGDLSDKLLQNDSNPVSKILFDKNLLTSSDTDNANEQSAGQFTEMFDSLISVLSAFGEENQNENMDMKDTNFEEQQNALLNIGGSIIYKVLNEGAKNQSLTDAEYELQEQLVGGIFKAFENYLKHYEQMLKNSNIPEIIAGQLGNVSEIKDVQIKGIIGTSGSNSGYIFLRDGKEGSDSEADETEGDRKIQPGSRSVIRIEDLNQPTEILAKKTGISKETIEELKTAFKNSSIRLGKGNGSASVIVKIVVVVNGEKKSYTLILPADTIAYVNSTKPSEVMKEILKRVVIKKANVSEYVVNRLFLLVVIISLICMVSGMGLAIFIARVQFKKTHPFASPINKKQPIFPRELIASFPLKNK